VRVIGHEGGVLAVRLLRESTRTGEQNASDGQSRSRTQRVLGVVETGTQAKDDRTTGQEAQANQHSRDWDEEGEPSRQHMRSHLRTACGLNLASRPVSVSRSSGNEPAAAAARNTSSGTWFQQHVSFEHKTIDPQR
jgi:hypothetical protein